MFQDDFISRSPTQLRLQGPFPPSESPFRGYRRRCLLCWLQPLFLSWDASTYSNFFKAFVLIWCIIFFCLLLSCLLPSSWIQTLSKGFSCSLFFFFFCHDLEKCLGDCRSCQVFTEEKHDYVMISCHLESSIPSTSFRILLYVCCYFILFEFHLHILEKKKQVCYIIPTLHSG